MTTLVACVSTGKRELGHVSRVISGENWDKVVLITDGTDFDSPKKAEFIKVDTNRMLPDLTEDIRKALAGKVSGTEAAINLVSGTGKMHMALMSALLKLGLGIRLVALTVDGVKEI